MIRNGPHGREFYRLVSFWKGSQIDKAHIAIVPKAQLPEDHALWQYAFGWDDDNFAIALGEMSMCNHSDEPNAEVIKHTSDRMFELVALRDIPPGEAITIKYETVLFGLGR